MRDKIQLWCILILTIISILLLVPSISFLIDPPISEDKIWASNRELIRIPLEVLKSKGEIEKSIRIPPNYISESGSVGKRHFQISIVSSEISPTMQPWNQDAIQVQVSSGLTNVPLKSVNIPFYAHSGGANAPYGLSFDSTEGTLCKVSIHFASNPYPKDSFLIVAPNWDNPQFIKDMTVGSMLNNDFSKVFGWLAIAGVFLLGISILLIVELLRKHNKETSPSPAT